VLLGRKLRQHFALQVLMLNRHALDMVQMDRAII
jgi:hypothetical protein